MKAFACCALVTLSAAEHNLKSLEVKHYPPHLIHDAFVKHHPPVPFERGPLNCTCPDTYQLVGQRCERTIRFPLETLCPPGYEQIDAQNCIKQVLPEERCPFGFARVKSDCVKRDIQVPQLGCPEGFTLESTSSWNNKKTGDQLLCVQRVPVDTELECPDGTAATGQCLTPVTTPASYTCPAGFIPGPANTCNKVTDVDCAPKKLPHPAPLRKLEVAEEGLDTFHHHLPPFSAAFTNANTLKSPAVQTYPKGTFRDQLDFAALHLGEMGNVPTVSLGAGGYGVNDKGHLRANRFEPDTVLVGGKNPQAAIGFHHWHGGHIPVHPASGAVSISETCTANITLEATPYCPTGELRGRLCVQMQPTDAVAVCPAFGSVENCYAYDRRNPISECPEGYTQECAVRGTFGHNSVDCECVNTIQTSVEVLCPPGAEYLDGLCQFTASPYSGCPIGSRMVDGACEELQVKPCVCTYTVNFACQGPSCTSHPGLKSLLTP